MEEVGAEEVDDEQTAQALEGCDLAQRLLARALVEHVEALEGNEAALRNAEGLEHLMSAQGGHRKAHSAWLLCKRATTHA